MPRSVTLDLFTKDPLKQVASPKTLQENAHMKPHESLIALRVFRAAVALRVVLSPFNEPEPEMQSLFSEGEGILHWLPDDRQDSPEGTSLARCR